MPSLLLNLLVMNLLVLAAQADGGEIQTGFFFAHGRYVTPPYKVTWENYTLSINGFAVRSFLPPQKQPATESIVFSPGRMTIKGTPFLTLCVIKFNKWRAERGPAEAFRLLSEFLGSQPFIKTFSLYQQGVLITDREGFSQYVNLTSRSDKPIPEHMAKLGNQYVSNFVQALEQGGAILTFTSGALEVIPPRRIFQWISRIHDVLSKGISDSEAIQLLREQYPIESMARDLVNNFRVTQELEQRLQGYRNVR